MSGLFQIPEGAMSYAIRPGDIGLTWIINGEFYKPGPGDIGRIIEKRAGFWYFASDPIQPELPRSADPSSEKAKASEFRKPKLRDLVQKALELDPSGDLRDSDEKLCAYIWRDQLIRLGKRQIFFLEIYESGALFAAEAIVRARRMIEKDRPDLRGQSWEKRQRHASKIREEISGSIPDISLPAEMIRDENEEYELENRERVFGEEGPE